MPLNAAKQLPGVRAVFGEKYPDPVRVIAIGTDDPGQQSTTQHSIEFCGGTHLGRTGEAGLFKVLAEEAVAKGIRRITAVTGRAAVEHVQHIEATLRSIGQTLSVSPEDAPRRIAALQDEVRQLKKKLQSGGGGGADPITAAGKLLDEATDVGGGKVVVGEIPLASEEQLRNAMDWLKTRTSSYAILLGAVSDEKVAFVAAVSDDLIARGLKAGDWVRQAAKVAGGGGGGRPQMAQAGGKDPDKLSAALETALTFAQSSVKPT
jgi:alanyl-tRNA synthetase